MRLARGESAGDVRVEMGGESDLEARGPMRRDRRGRVTWSPVGGVRRGELAGRVTWSPVGGVRRGEFAGVQRINWRRLER